MHFLESRTLLTIVWESASSPMLRFSDHWLRMRWNLVNSHHLCLSYCSNCDGWTNGIFHPTCRAGSSLTGSELFLFLENRHKRVLILDGCYNCLSGHCHLVIFWLACDILTFFRVNCACKSRWCLHLLLFLQLQWLAEIVNYNLIVYSCAKKN